MAHQDMLWRAALAAEVVPSPFAASAPEVRADPHKRRPRDASHGRAPGLLEGEKIPARRDLLAAMRNLIPAAPTRGTDGTHTAPRDKCCAR